MTSGSIGAGRAQSGCLCYLDTVQDMQRVDMVLGTVGEPSPVDRCGVWLGRHLSVRKEVAFSRGPLVGGNI